MSRVRDSEGLFVQGLQTALGAELSIEEMLGRLAKDAADAQLRAGLARHRAETHEHVLSLETSLRIVIGEVEAAPTPGLDGLVRELEASLSSLDPQAGATLRDLVILRSAGLVEHYELGMYEPLVEEAELFGEDDVAVLLGRSLEDERAMLDEGLAITGRLARTVIASPARA